MKRPSRHYDERCAPLKSRHEEIQRSGPMAIRYYVRARLHRRFFVLLGLAVVLMMCAAFAVTHYFFPHSEFPAKRNAIETLFADQFAKNWKNPIERSRFAETTHQAFGVALTLLDGDGKQLSAHGGGCLTPHFTLDIRSEGSNLGQVLACTKTATEAKRALLFGFLASAFVLWIAAGVLAHRFGRPLWQLVQVTRELGAGKLESRARLGRHQPGEVGILAESINDMAERIEKQVSDQRELLAAVSHEIRTPLARLRVVSELLRDEGASAALVAEVEREIDEVNDLTGQLLASSRLDFGTLEKSSVSLVEIVREALRRMSFDERLLVAVENDPFELTLDPTLVARALANLLGNATSHGEGLRSVEITRQSGMTRIGVSDRGPGLGEGDPKRLFEAFVRGQGTKKSASSLGLGLALVRRIAVAHGGDVFAENLPEGGARVGFWLPSP